MASSSTTSPSPVQEQQDRIGSLPDTILLLILSFLPTLDAVRTSVLATRWRTLWTSVCELLDFDEKDDGDFFFGTGKDNRGTKIMKRERESKRTFVEFVGKVLSFHHTSTLHRLRLTYCSQNCPLHDWVHSAVSRGVQTLHLRLLCTDISWLPSLLFATQTLVDLRLDLGGSELILPETMALVGLRRMRLCRVNFCDDHSTRALFSSSTALRSLALENCDFQKLGCLEISCSSLQELAIEDTSLEEDDDDMDGLGSSLEEEDDLNGLNSCQVKIAAPHLTSFIYVAPVAHTYVVEPLICIEYVKIQFRSFKRRKESDKLSMLGRASSFLCSFTSARNLDICQVCFKALMPSDSRTSVLLHLFRNLNVLRMAVDFLNYKELVVVVSLLVLNPQLRALNIEVIYMYAIPSPDRKEEFLKVVDACRFERRNGIVERVQIRCRESNLYSDMEALRYSAETVLELVRLLLGTQPRLEKLVLANHLFWDRDPTNSRLDAIMEKVLSYPRLTRGLAVAFI